MDACQQSFEELKGRLTLAPVLALPMEEMGLWFIVMLLGRALVVF